MQRHAEAAGPLNAQGAFPILAHLKNSHVDHNFGARLVEVADELLGEQQFVGRAAHHNGVLALHRVDLGLGIRLRMAVLYVVEIVLLPGIGQVKGLNGLFVELGALGAGVGGHKDGVRGDRAPEGVGHGADDAQGIEQRHIGQLHRDALGVEVRVEEHVDAGGFSNGLVNQLCVFSVVKGERIV